MNTTRFCLAIGGRDIQKFLTHERLRDLRPECFSWLAINEVAVLGWRDKEDRYNYFSTVRNLPVHIWEVPFETPGES